MSTTALRFAQVLKTYAGMPALADFSLEVRAGESFGLVGVNGAGKTTLIKCLLDFCGADRGSIEIFGVPHRATVARARLAYLPERFNPPFYLTGRDFLKYMHKLYGERYEDARVAGMFAALDLELSALDRPARTYSKGMTQKLGLPREPERHRGAPHDQHRDPHLRRAEPEYDAAHRDELRQAELETDAEHEEHDADLGEKPGALGIGYPPERVRPDHRADDEIAQHRRQRERAEHHDHQHRGGEQDQDRFQGRVHTGRKAVSGER